MNENQSKDLKIDLSKISNLNVKEIDSSIIKTALEKNVEKTIQELPKDFKREKRSNKFNFTQPSIIPLPSGGKFYRTDDEDIKKGKIKIYPLTMREEEILSTPRYILDGVATIMVLNNCIASDIDAMDLLMYDYTYLLFYLRKISFGDSYNFDITCPNCGHKYNTGFKISDIVFNELPKDFKEPYKIDLPISKYTVIMSMPRVRHSREFDDLQNKLTSKERKEYSGISDIFAIRTISIIDNEGNLLPKEDWVEFYKSIPAMDRAELSKYSVIESGINKVMENLVCPNCDTVIGGSIPITDEFFRFESR